MLRVYFSRSEKELNKPETRNPQPEHSQPATFYNNSSACNGLRWSQSL